MDRIAAAPFALLVMYAWDMCDINPPLIPPVDDARIAKDGWTVVGYISGSDDMVVVGAGLRSAVLGASSGQDHRVCYGYVAERGSQFVVAIRGTDGAEEWADDLDFLMIDHPTAGAGLVDRGFWEIYDTMQFHGLEGKPAVRLAAGIIGLTGDSPVMVLGHSLGSSLATYLTLELNLAGSAASACLFASPRTGNQIFVDFFETKVANYDVFNYERDVVPMVPRRDVLHFSDYYPLKQAKTIPVDASALGVRDNPLCNHHLICYIALLDPGAWQRAMAVVYCTPDDRKCAQCVFEVTD